MLLRTALVVRAWVLRLLSRPSTRVSQWRSGKVGSLMSRVRLHVCMRVFPRVCLRMCLCMSVHT